jgi:hypothetical protein
MKLTPELQIVLGGITTTHRGGRTATSNMTVHDAAIIAGTTVDVTSRGQAGAATTMTEITQAIGTVIGGTEIIEI